MKYRKNRSLAASLALSLAIVTSSGCVSLRTAETPSQRFYAAVAEYSILAEAAANYVELPTADPRAVKGIKEVDRVAYQAIQAGKTALAAFNMVQAVRDQKLLAAANVLKFARSQLQSWLVKEGSP